LSSDSHSQRRERRSGCAWIATLALVGALLAAVCPSAFAQVRAPTSTPARAADTTGLAPGPPHATGAATRLPHTPGAAPGTTETTGIATGTATATAEAEGTATATTDTTAPATAMTETTAAATATTGPAGATDPAAGATDPAAGTTDPTAGTTDPTAGTTDPAAGTTDGARTSDPVIRPGPDWPAGTTEPAAQPTEPAAPNHTSVDAVSARLASPVVASARSTETAVGGAGRSACGRLACFDAVGALKALDPALADLSVLRGTTLMGRRRGPAAALAAVSESRPAPEAPESPAQSQISGGGGASPFGGDFSLSLFALLLMALAGLAPLLSERLVVASAPWRSVALVLLLERPD
jgi:hypothetical protein